MIYKIWYKKEIKSSSLEQAVKEADKVKPVFHSIETIEEKQPQDFSPAIGFHYYSPDE